jgi:hypothetical protein
MGMALMPQESEIAVGSESVPTAVAGGSTMRIQNQQHYRMLIVDPPATAGGTDSDPSATPDFRARELEPRLSDKIFPARQVINHQLQQLSFLVRLDHYCSRSSF